jgi:hypothetical protein
LSIKKRELDCSWSLVRQLRIRKIIHRLNLTSSRRYWRCLFANQSHVTMYVYANGGQIEEELLDTAGGRLDDADCDR